MPQGDDSASKPRNGSRPHTVAEARAEAEALRAARREVRERRLHAAFSGPVPGRGVLVVSWAATSVLAAVSLVALLDPDAIGAYFVVTFAMFCLGALLLALDVMLAVARSTRDAMGIGGLFFLADAAPRGVQRSLNGSLAAAVGISVTTAVVGLSTPELAFGTLVPLFQLSLTGFWGVRHGLFGERQDAPGDD